MWLLSTSRAELTYFANPSQVRFAILSHVWRENEQSFQDVQQLQTQYASGNPRDHTSEKIKRCCLYAEQHGFKWVWVDTCCIDKSSSAELSEAINSMYKWYAGAAVCYVFLDDVGDEEDPRESPTPLDTPFAHSEWFTRGWTLQELIAPTSLLFLSRHWRTLGTKYDMAEFLKTITGIDVPILRHEMPLSSISVARRMSWAARRQTTRIEDRAYSLMGLFGIHMTPIYGEGTKAFIRLQQEIIKHSPDHSIFAWGPIHQSYPSASTNAFAFSHNLASDRALLASSPDAFEQSADIHAWDLHNFTCKLHCEVPDFHLSGYGMRTTLPTLRTASAEGGYVYAVMLACKDGRGFPVMLFLQPSDVINLSTFTVGEYIKDDLAPVYSYYRAAYFPLGKDATTARVFCGLRPTELYIELHRGALQQAKALRAYDSQLPITPSKISPRIHHHTMTGTSSNGYTFFFPPWVITRMTKCGFTPDRPCDDGMTVELAPCHGASLSPFSRPARIPFSIVTFTNSSTRARFSVIFGYRRNTTCGRSSGRSYCPSILVTSAGMPHQESAKSSECLYIRRVSNFTVLAGKVVQVQVKEPWERFRPPRGRLKDSMVHFIDLRIS